MIARDDNTAARPTALGRGLDTLMGERDVQGGTEKKAPAEPTTDVRKTPVIPTARGRPTRQKPLRASAIRTVPGSGSKMANPAPRIHPRTGTIRRTRARRQAASPSSAGSSPEARQAPWPSPRSPSSA